MDKRVGLWGALLVGVVLAFLIGSAVAVYRTPPPPGCDTSGPGPVKPTVKPAEVKRAPSSPVEPAIAPPAASAPPLKNPDLRSALLTLAKSEGKRLASWDKITPWVGMMDLQSHRRPTVGKGETGATQYSVSFR